MCVSGDGFTGGFEGLCEPTVDGFQAVVVDQRDHRFADSVVVGLDQILVERSSRSHEPRAAQQRRSGARVVEPDGRAIRRPLGDRASRDRDGLEQHSRCRRKLAQPRSNHRVERDRFVELDFAIAALQVPRELHHQIRIASGLARDRLRACGGAAAPGGKHRERELGGLRRRQRSDRQLDGAGHCLDEGAHARARDRVGRAVTAHEQQRRRIVAGGDVGEQRRALGVAPLEIVDPQHQRRAARQPTQQLAQTCGAAALQLVHVRAAERFFRCAEHRLDPAEDREHARERRRVGWHEVPRLRPRQLEQMPAQAVDERIDRFVRNRFALVAAPREDDGGVLAL
jgi:hypothetical protein